MKAPPDPPRLRTANDSPPELARALELARGDLPSASDLARVASGLGALLADGDAGQPSPPPRSSRGSMRPVAAGATIGVKLLLAATVAATGLGVGVWQLLGSEGGESKPAVPAAAPSSAPPQRAPASSLDGPGVADPPPPEAPPSAPVVRRNDRLPPAVAAPRAAASPAEPVGAAELPDLDSSGEIALLGEAERALASDPARALRLTEQHGQRFPTGALAQEREVIAIRSLLALGRRSDAAARAASFRARFPASAHRRRLDLLLGESPDGSR